MQVRPIPADFVVRSPYGDAVAVVEITNFPDFPAADAAEFRRNLVVHGINPRRTDYFLMVSQDVGYLWQGADATSGKLVPPNVTFPMIPIVRRYLRSLAPGERLIVGGLNLAISAWLWDLSAGNLDESQEPEATLAATGFLTAMRYGTVTEDFGD